MLTFLSHEIRFDAFIFSSFNRLTEIIESEEIKATNNFLRRDLFEYLRITQNILYGILEFLQNIASTDVFNNTMKTIRENKKIIRFALSSYRKYLVSSTEIAVRKLNYDDVEHPAVSFTNSRQQIDRVDRAMAYIQGSFFP